MEVVLSDYSAELTLFSPESPAGENLEYDPLYLALEDEASAQDGGAISDDDAVTAADYKLLQKHCTALWQRTRDFKVAVFYTVALTVNQGLTGFNHGLALLNFLSTDLWQEAYPQLDPDDDLDPTERLNILSTLSPHNTVNDPINFLYHFMFLKLCAGAPYTLRDLLQAKGTIENRDGIDPALLTAQVLAAGPAAISAMTEQVQTAVTQLEALEQNLNAQLKDTGYITFERLHKILVVWQHFCQEVNAALSAHSASAAATGSEAGVENNSGAFAVGNNLAAAAVGMAGAAGSASVAGVVGAAGVAAAVRPFNVNDVVITNRRDALALLEKCSAYFQLAEPTSPVPFLLKRAVAMATMDFMQLLAEIDSSALERGKEQFGIKDQPSD